MKKLFLDHIEITEETEVYHRVCHWHRLLIRWIQAHPRDLIVEAIE